MVFYILNYPQVARSASKCDDVCPKTDRTTRETYADVMANSTAYALLYALSGGVSLAVATWVWSRRDQRGARAFIALLFAIATWAFVDALAILTASSPDSWLVWQKVRWSIAAFVPALWFVFTLRYTDLYSQYVRPVTAIVLTEAAIVAGLTLTNASHQLVWEAVTLQDGVAPTVETTAGPVYIAHLTIAAALVLGGMVLLLQVLVNARNAHQSQPALLLAGGSLAVVLSAGSTFGTFPLGSADVTALGFGLGSGLIGWALYRHQLFDIYPVETDTVMTAMRDAVIAVNDERLVTDTNPAADGLLTTAEPLGTPLSEVLPTEPEDAWFCGEPGTHELTIDEDGEQRYYVLDVTPLHDDPAQRGHLLIFRDETTRRKQRRELERQSEHMEQFASTVSHDLRNPLTVAESGIELVGREADTDRVEIVADSLDRMRTIIDESLSFARSGQRMDEGDLWEVELEHVATAAWEHVDTGGAAIEIESSSTLIANEDRLTRLFENLFRNSVEHGGDAPTIRVGTLDSGGFYVADDGPGIPEEKREEIFERGFTTEDDGTGFGLAIVDAIVGAHDWSITVTDSETGGARFEVET